MIRTAISLAALVVGTAAAELPAVKYERFASGFDSPLEMVPYGKGAQAFLVVDQSGVVNFLGEKGGEPGAVFLDLRERALRQVE